MFEGQTQVVATVHSKKIKYNLSDHLSPNRFFIVRILNLLEMFAFMISFLKEGVGSSGSPNGSSTMGSSLRAGVLLLSRGSSSKSMTWVVWGVPVLDHAFVRASSFSEFLDVISVSPGSHLR